MTKNNIQPGVKDTKGKLKLNYIPPKSMVAIAKVREFGSIKYKDPWKWKEFVELDDLIEACKRHLLKRDLGEELDDESGLPHIYHALCSLAMAVEIMDRKDK